MNKIDGSVIITTKDKNSRLKLTLQALDMQVKKNNIEVVIVFDGCNKETIEEFDTITLSFLPIKVILEKNLGRSGARNEGIRSSKGDVLIFLDDDRIPSPNFIEENLKKHEDNCVVLSDRYEINYSEQELENIYSSRKAVYNFKWFISSAKLDFYYHLKKIFLINSKMPLRYIAFTTGTVSIDRSIIKKVGLFDETFSGWGYEDVDLGYRISKSGYKFFLINSTKTYHITHTINKENKKYEEIKNLKHFSGKYKDDYLLQVISKIRCILLRVGISPC